MACQSAVPPIGSVEVTIRLSLPTATQKPVVGQSTPSRKSSPGSPGPSGNCVVVHPAAAAGAAPIATATKLASTAASVLRVTPICHLLSQVPDPDPGHCGGILRLRRGP